MSLGIYYKNEENQYIEVSRDQDLSLPIKTIHNGRTGDYKVFQLYIRNNDTSKNFSNIVVSPEDFLNPYGDNEAMYNESGWGVKLSTSVSLPSVAEWENTPWGEVASFALIEGTNYIPFWYYITCPPNNKVEIKTNIILRVYFTENAV
jgi:hypothetical protein